MRCNWFTNNKFFYINAPGVVLPCCTFPIHKLLLSIEEKQFYNKYFMLYLKNNLLENIVLDVKNIVKLIRDSKENGDCEKSLCSQFIQKNGYVKNKYSFMIMLTTKCTLKCLACLRNSNKNLSKQILTYDWDFDFIEFQKHFNPNFLQKIDSIEFTGGIGDATLYKKLLILLKYIYTYNNDIYITIHTNGNYRHKFWWELLAYELNHFKNYSFVFAIDGLKDTYHIYRVNGDFDKVIQNAKYFINAGGKAIWKYIKLKYNEHQIEEARELSKKIGFHTFVVMDAWNKETDHEIYNRNIL